MKKLLLAGNVKERKKLLKTLQKFGAAEIAQSQSAERTEFCADDAGADVLAQKLARLEFLFSQLKYGSAEMKRMAKKDKQLRYKPQKLDGLLVPAPALTFEELCASEQYAGEVFAAVSRLEALSARLTEERAQEQKFKTMAEQLAPYLNMELPFSKIKDTRCCAVTAGWIPAAREGALDAARSMAYIEEFPSGSGIAIVAVMHKEARDAVMQVLSEAEFVKCPLGYDKTAKAVAEEIRAGRQALREAHVAIVSDIVAEEAVLPQARQLYDYYLLEARKLECEALTASTVSSYFLEAWVPAAMADRLDAALAQSPLALAYILRDPSEGEEPPSFVENSGVATPYQSVTNMFSAPQYGEIDPNPFVAFFFFLFFGMMVSDAGYGLLLVLATGTVLAMTRPPKGHSNLIKIIFMGGISTVIWGIVFGSYFGMSAKDLGIWYWFNPIEKPINMLFLSLGMGIFQMCFGIGINMAALIKQHKPFEGFCAAFSWYFLIIGIALGAAGKMLLKKLFLPGVEAGTMVQATYDTLVRVVPAVGWAILGAGVVLLILAGTFGKKGFKKVSGGLGSLYGIINFFSDLMSYTRIFGLGLATGVIGMVFNQIGGIIMDLLPARWLGIIAAGVIYVIGHVFNVAINTLGAYVHNSRLQFVEFFGKFYSGGGRLFRPLGSEMKYYYIKQPQEVKE